MATVAEIAAYLGVSASAIRHVVRRHGIEPVGHNWKAKLYVPAEVLRHTGHRDRLRSQARSCHTHS